MSTPRIRLDFIARRRSATLVPVVVAACGAVAVLVTLAEYGSLRSEAEGLEARLGAYDDARDSHSAKSPAGERPITAEARAAASHLATPWGSLLDDLEAAGVDSAGTIAVLTVEPDRDSHRVIVVAEARSLPAALRYVQRLQQSKALAHPLLDSHEVRTDVPERPVRVQITAEWKLPS